MNLKFFKIAIIYSFRNIARNKRRTFFILLTIMISVCVSIVGIRFAKASLNFWIQSTTESGIGDAKIYKTNFDELTTGFNLKHLLHDNNEIELFLQKNKDVFAYSKKIDFEGIISSGTKAMYFLAQGIEEKKEKLVSKQIFTSYNIQGKFINSNNIDGIVIGAELSKILNISIGDQVTLTVNSSENNINAEDAVVIGIIDIPFEMLSKRLIYTSITKAQRLLQISNSYTELTIKLKPQTDLHKWYLSNTNIISQKNGVLKMWWDIYPIILNIQNLWYSVISIIVILLFCVTAIAIVNIIYILITERVIEIGTLLAIGAQPYHIVKLFIIEILSLGTIGSITGAILANIIILIMKYYGIPFENPLGAGYFIIHPQVSLISTLIIICLSLITCFFASLIPSYHASKLNPIKAFRGEHK